MVTAARAAALSAELTGESLVGVEFVIVPGELGDGWQQMDPLCIAFGPVLRFASGGTLVASWEAAADGRFGLTLGCLAPSHSPHLTTVSGSESVVWNAFVRARLTGLRLVACRGVPTLLECRFEAGRTFIATGLPERIGESDDILMSRVSPLPEQATVLDATSVAR